MVFHLTLSLRQGIHLSLNHYIYQIPSHIYHILNELLVGLVPFKLDVELTRINSRFNNLFLMYFTGKLTCFFNLMEWKRYFRDKFVGSSSFSMNGSVYLKKKIFSLPTFIPFIRKLLSFQLTYIYREFPLSYIFVPVTQINCNMVTALHLLVLS